MQVSYLQVHKGRPGQHQFTDQIGKQCLIHGARVRDKRFTFVTMLT